MRKMKDSGIDWIGAIPENWSVKKFKYFFDIIGGCGFKEEYQGKETGDFPFCKASDINGKEKTVSSAKNYVDNDLVSSERYSVIPAGSILIAKIGEALKKNHRKINTVPCIVDNNCEAFLPNSECDINYLYYVLKHIDMFWFDNGGTIPSVNNAKLRNFYLPCNEVATQKRISTYLDDKCSRLDYIIAKQHEVIEKLNAYKLSVIAESVTKGIVSNRKVKDSNCEFIGQVPAEWQVMKFGRCVAIKSNLVPPEDYAEYPQISPEHIEKNSGRLLDTYTTVKESGVISGNHLFFEGQIIYSKIRPMLNKVTVAPFDGLCSADMYPIETDNYTRFILYMMLSDYFTAQVGLVTENRVKMPKINQNELSNITVALPPMEEQKEIADYLDKKCAAIDSSIAKRQQLIDKLTEYKKSLIFEVVTGKKEV